MLCECYAYIIGVLYSILLELETEHTVFCMCSQQAK